MKTTPRKFRITMHVNLNEYNDVIILIVNLKFTNRLIANILHSGDNIADSKN